MEYLYLISCRNHLLLHLGREVNEDCLEGAGNVRNFAPSINDSDI